jgi:hypothetical protein
MILFGQKQMTLSKKQVIAMLTPEQMANYSKHCIIPKRPDQPLTQENSITVTSPQRIYVVGKWRILRDPDQYERDLQYILAAPSLAAS